MRQLETRHWQAQEGDIGRVDAFIAKRLQFPRSQSRGLVQLAGVTINHSVLHDPAAMISAGDHVALSFDPTRRYREAPPTRATNGFRMVHADDHLVVVEKAAGILTVPTDKARDNTLVDRISHHLARGQSRHRKVMVVHRLDRETSGLLVFGRDIRTTEGLIEQFAERKPERIYQAIVAGKIAKASGKIESYLQTDSALNQKSVAGGLGEYAITHFQTAKVLRNCTIINVQLETGRRNQIRAHFSEQGHPVLGDQRYRPDLATHPHWSYGRLALHAKTLSFAHPITGNKMRFDSPIPPEFVAFERKNSL